MERSELASGSLAGRRDKGRTVAGGGARRCQAEPSYQTTRAHRQPPLFPLGRRAHSLPVSGARGRCGLGRSRAGGFSSAGRRVGWASHRRDLSPLRVVSARSVAAQNVFSARHPRSASQYVSCVPGRLLCWDLTFCPRIPPGRQRGARGQGRPQSGRGQLQAAASRGRGEGPRGWDPGWSLSPYAAGPAAFGGSQDWPGRREGARGLGTGSGRRCPAPCRSASRGRSVSPGICNTFCKVFIR